MKGQLEKYRDAGRLGRTEEENARHYEVARRYATLCEAATDRVATSRFEPRRGQGQVGHDFNEEAKERLRNADRILGRSHARCLRFVCVHGWSAEKWASEEGETREGVGVSGLRIALRELSRHWSR